MSARANTNFGVRQRRQTPCPNPGRLNILGRSCCTCSQERKKPRTQSPKSSYPVCPIEPRKPLVDDCREPRERCCVLVDRVPLRKRRNAGPGHTPATCRMAPRGTNRAPMATATPNSFPGGVAADSSGFIDPSAPVSICPQPVGGVLGGVVAYSTVMALGVTADDPRGRQSPSEQDFLLQQFFFRLVWWCRRVSRQRLHPRLAQHGAGKYVLQINLILLDLIRP